MSECVLVVDGEAMLSGIYNDDLTDLMAEGQAMVVRASNVEPALGGGWEADMRPIAGESGPVLRAADDRGFTLRAEALDAEVEWIKREVLHV